MFKKRVNGKKWMRQHANYVCECGVWILSKNQKRKHRCLGVSPTVALMEIDDSARDQEEPSIYQKEQPDMHLLPANIQPTSENPKSLESLAAVVNDYLLEFIIEMKFKLHVE